MEVVREEGGCGRNERKCNKAVLGQEEGISLVLNIRRESKEEERTFNRPSVMERRGGEALALS